mgnify:CR=1 FL=1
MGAKDSGKIRVGFDGISLYSGHDCLFWDRCFGLGCDFAVDFDGFEFGESTQTAEIVDVAHVVECVVGILDGNFDGFWFGEVEIEYGSVETGAVT